MTPSFPCLAAVFVLTLSTSNLSACSFRPLYGGEAFTQLPGLKIIRDQTRVDYLIENALQDFLGAGRSPYHLYLDSKSRSRSLGLSEKGIARQYVFEIRTQYRLENTQGDILLQGDVFEETLYDSGPDPYIQISGESTAETQTAEAVAERLVRKIAVTLRKSEAGLLQP